MSYQRRWRDRERERERERWSQGETVEVGNRDRESQRLGKKKFEEKTDVR